MTYEIFETSGISPRKTVLATADTFEDAVALAHNRFDIVAFEVDDDHPGCADFFTSCLRVMSIEPHGRTGKAS